MRQFLGLLLLVLLVNSCDDGNMNFSSFNFNNAAVNQCPNSREIIYKINGNEALILSIPENNFKNLDQSKVSLTIGVNNVTATYRLYSTTVSETNICSTIPNSNPTVVGEWTALSGADGKEGIIEIYTTAIKSATNTITGYTHTITFLDVTFSNGDNSKNVVYTTYRFGNYTTAVLPFDFKTVTMQSCINNLLFRRNPTEALLLYLPPTIFPNEVGTIKRSINADNRLVYRKYENGIITNDFICAAIPPINPTIQYNLIAADGVDQIIIETTEPTLGRFSHKISLKDIIFNDSSGDQFRDKYDLDNFGSFETSAP